MWNGTAKLFHEARGDDVGVVAGVAVAGIGDDEPRKFAVIATTNLNGDYLSDACAAQVGGLGVAPGANIGEGMAVFEPTHGTAPDIAGKGIANPGSMLLTGAMLLEYLGWVEASQLVVDSFASVVGSGRMTVDLVVGRPEIQLMSTTGFGDAVAEEVIRRHRATRR